jgi:hypothetical protein
MSAKLAAEAAKLTRRQFVQSIVKCAAAPSIVALAAGWNQMLSSKSAFAAGVDATRFSDGTQFTDRTVFS